MASVTLADGGQAASILEARLERTPEEKGHSASRPRGAQEMLLVLSAHLGTDKCLSYTPSPRGRRSKARMQGHARPCGQLRHGAQGPDRHCISLTFT